MKTRTAFFITFSLLLLAFSSCKKYNDFPEIEEPQGTLRLKRIALYESMTSVEPKRVLEDFEYDNKGRISKVTAPLNYSSGPDYRILYYNIYNYNADNQLEKIENFHSNINSSTGFINFRNNHYIYLEDGKKEIEYIELPVIGSFEYSLFEYEHDKLIKTEYYKMGTDELESYIEYDYNKNGQLIKETSRQTGESYFINYTEHNYANGLIIESNTYMGRSPKKIEHIRTTFKTYDNNNNLLFDRIEEHQIFSSQPSRVIRYEYYEE